MSRPGGVRRGHRHAARHGDGPRPVGLRLPREEVLTVEVADGGSTLTPHPRRAHHGRAARTTDEGGGRGLFLVAKLSRRRGSRPAPDGKDVRAELDHPRSAAPTGPVAAAPRDVPAEVSSAPRRLRRPDTVLPGRPRTSGVTWPIPAPAGRRACNRRNGGYVASWQDESVTRLGRARTHRERHSSRRPSNAR
ncbi:ATP-binding protein [Streptomyces sp. NPDC093594]|uniref:ATP-binding protein n=1 Tax=Streptomyces sp. NPDC093594 TaxID=3155305 RepID=UPI00344DBEFA